MRTAQSRSRRGQAIVESTLGIIVFVTVFLFGMHFAEVTFTQMKVTEAAQAAIWDSTSGQMHRLPRLIPGTQNFSLAGGRVALAKNEVQTRYQDFDGRGLTTGPVPRQILSSAQAGSMKVQCGIGSGWTHRGAFPILFLHEALAYSDNGGMSCTAEAFIDPFGTMKIGKFLEGAGGFFQASQQRSAAITTGYRACSVNRPNGLNGPCRGDFAGLIDDWGMADPDDGVCPVIPWGLPCPTNIGFWTAAMGMYELDAVFGTQNNADLNLVKLVNPPPRWAWVGIPLLPGSPTSFYMNFMGESTLFIGFAWAGDLSSMIWWVTPFGLTFPGDTLAWGFAKANGGCYLGQKCNNSTIANP